MLLRQSLSQKCWNKLCFNVLFSAKKVLKALIYYVVASMMIIMLHFIVTFNSNVKAAERLTVFFCCFIYFDEIILDVKTAPMD